MLNRTTQCTNQTSSLLPMSIIGGLFFVFGFVTWLNASLIPFLQIACELTHTQAYLVTMVFYIAYTVTALPVSGVLKRCGYRNSMVLGLFVMAIGAGLFIPAAEFRAFELFLGALFILATGMTLLQTAANPYIVLLGPPESAAVRISIMGLLNKGAGVFAPLLFTAFILSDMSQFNEAGLALLSNVEREMRLDQLSQRLISPYFLLTGCLSMLALLMYWSPLPEPDSRLTKPDEVKNKKSNVLETLRHPQLALGVIALFVYVGAEVIAADTIGLFGKHLGVEQFGALASYTMVFMVLAYLVGMAVMPRYISQEKALAISACVGVVLSILIITTPSEQRFFSQLFNYLNLEIIPDVVLYVGLLGLANALVWPAIWPLALRGLGQYTSTGSALLIMSISGGAILPMIYGMQADRTGDPQIAYCVLLPCYIIILGYSTAGYKMKQWKTSKERQALSSIDN